MIQTDTQWFHMLDYRYSLERMRLKKPSFACILDDCWQHHKGDRRHGLGTVVTYSTGRGSETLSSSTQCDVSYGSESEYIAEMVKQSFHRYVSRCLS